MTISLDLVVVNVMLRTDTIIRENLDFSRAIMGETKNIELTGRYCANFFFLYVFSGFE